VGAFVPWDPTTGKNTTTLEGHRLWVRAVAWSPDGTRLATGGDNTVRIWDPTTGKNTTTLELLPKWPTAPGTNYVVWEGDGKIRFASPDAWPYLGWQVPGENGEPIRRLPAEYYGPLPLPPGTESATFG
jgi:WD40 repeat protein